MQIIGQFNLGFILAKLDDDIFIFDQHASDEKFQYERLLNHTKLETQKLVSPIQLSLSIQNESTLTDNQKILRYNGFTFFIDEESK